MDGRIAFANLRRRRLCGAGTTADLLPCGGDVRQDRGGQRRAPAFVWIAALAGVAASAPTLAACPIELAVYGDRDGAASVEFIPTVEGAAVTNTFRMLLGDDVVLDGIVMWSQEVARPNGMLMHDCPEGDVTGDEIAACTPWQGVIYTSDTSGTIGLLPAEGTGAPETLIFPDLGPALRQSSAYGGGGFSNVPWDVFALKGCQE